MRFELANVLLFHFGARQAKKARRFYFLVRGQGLADYNASLL